MDKERYLAVVHTKNNGESKIQIIAITHYSMQFSQTFILMYHDDKPQGSMKQGQI